MFLAVNRQTSTFDLENESMPKSLIWTEETNLYKEETFDKAINQIKSIKLPVLEDKRSSTSSTFFTNKPRKHMAIIIIINNLI